MKRFQIEITAVVNFPYDPAQYPEGMLPETALSLEIEEAAKDPRELLALDPEVVKVTGQIQEERPYATLDDLLEKRRGAKSQNPNSDPPCPERMIIPPV